MKIQAHTANTNWSMYLHVYYLIALFLAIQNTGILELEGNLEIVSSNLKTYPGEVKWFSQGHRRILAPTFLCCFPTQSIKPGLNLWKVTQAPANIDVHEKNPPVTLLKLTANSHMTQSPCLLRRVWTITEKRVIFCKLFRTVFLKKQILCLCP